MSENEEKKPIPEKIPPPKPLEEEIKKREKKQWGQLEEKPELPKEKPDKNSKKN